jgi:hypothetical protein
MNNRFPSPYEQDAGDRLKAMALVGLIVQRAKRLSGLWPLVIPLAPHAAAI